MNLLGYLIGGLGLLVLVLLSWWSHANKRGPNDAISVLHIATVIATLLTLVFSVLATAGHTWSDPIFLTAIVGTYIGIDFMYSLVGTLADRHKIRVLDEDENVSDPYLRIGKRYGQYIGLGFMIICLSLVVLAALEVPAPFGAGYFVEVPEPTFVAIGITPFIIAAASAAKILVRKTARIVHNNVLLSMSVYSTVVFIVLIIVEATGGKEVPSDYPWIYLAALSSYAGHNIVLSLWCSDCKQERPGHLVALSVFLFGFLVFLLYGFEVLPYLPHTIFALMFMTALVMALGGSAKYGLEEWKELRKNREIHEQENHPSEKIKDCQECDDHPKPFS
ncbi:MAG: hypothetical protein R3346_02760 [Candidatus Spechtbacterales bacterium]|nr:hypothetical protein [Candidatus Spechtbacterales bacterium]